MTHELADFAMKAQLPTPLTLVQAQDRFVQRVNSCHTGHVRRVRRSAWKELGDWAVKHGYDSRTVCKDADDVANLQCISDD